MYKPDLTAIILTFNEEIHLERCLKSLKDVCQDIIIVDSFSNDKTKAIAEKYHTKFYQNTWINYSTQFNWGLENCEINTEWILRIDADEYLSNTLKNSIIMNLPLINQKVNGLMVNRLMYFLGKPIKRGGMYPISHLKIWRKGTAICEQRWMDERMKLLKGKISKLNGDLIDNNLNNLSWWTNKHNSYATREAIDILNETYNFSNNEIMSAKLIGNAEERRRWLKFQYLQLPLFVRPFLFFIIRYFIQGGFLEGKRGLIWNILQCFWYRFLVDAKIFEAYMIAGKSKECLIAYFKNKYGYNLINEQ